MSTLKTNNVQVGQSVTATNNFTLYQPSSPDGTVRLGVGNSGATTADVITANSSGNVGIGTSSPWSQISSYGASGATTQYIGFKNADGGDIRFGKQSGVDNTCVLGTWTGNRVKFYTNGVNVMDLDTSGNLLVGATSPWNNVARFFAYQPTSASNAIVGQLGTSSGSTFVGVNSSGSATFYVTVAGQIAAVSTSITGISDGRLKTNIQPIKYGLSDVLKLKPVIFDFIENDLVTGQKDNLGFVAQDVQPIIPELVNQSQSKAEDETPYLTLKMGDLLPVLVKAIQEQQALITSLTARIAALEGAQP